MPDGHVCVGGEKMFGDLFVRLFPVSHYFHSLLVVVFINEDGYFLSDVVRCQSRKAASVLQNGFYSIAFK